MTVCHHDVEERACALCSPRTTDPAPAPSRPFTARYSGVCGGCSFDVNAGEQVRYTATGGLAHVECS